MSMPRPDWKHRSEWLAQENERLRAALTYYADERVWLCIEIDECEAWNDAGKIARDALSK